MTTPYVAVPSDPHHGQLGVGLLEMLIGVGLTLVILATTMVALNDGVRMFDTAQAVSNIRHNGRNGLNLMTRDLIQTGQGIPTGGIPIPSGVGVTPIVRPGPGVLAYPAGTVVLWDGRTWHSAGENKSNEPRYGITTYYSGPQFRSLQNHTLGSKAALLDGASPELLTLLGFRAFGGYGHTGERDAEFARPSDGLVGELG